MMELNRRKILGGAVAATATTALTPFGTSGVFAAAPPVGKQAPGFYRYKIGTFEVTVVTDGAGAQPLPDAYVANVAKPDVSKALVAAHMDGEKITHAYTAVVINTGAKLVAIDTGLGLGVFQQSKGVLGQYHSNLEAAGIDRTKIDTVIISHFHGDHINGLVGPENKPAFPNAEVMVPEAEWAFWSDEANTPKLPEIARGQMGNVKRVFGVVGNKVTRYQPGKELVPGITAIATPGHTPGHVSHMVSSGNAKVLVQADVTAGAASLFAQHPDWQFVFDTDKPLAVQTRKKIYDMAVADKLVLQGYHFAFPAQAYVEKSGSGYRLVPLPWNPTI